MSAFFAESAYRRNAMLALEVLDAVTLQRVSAGIDVRAEGLRGKPVTNTGGLFVWKQEDMSALQRVVIDPLKLPYEAVRIEAADLVTPIHVVQLPPRASYAFAAGKTAVRSTLIESRADTPARPVTDAQVRLVWLDDDGVTWRDAPTLSHTDTHGDFAAIARLAGNDLPRLDANGDMAVRLRVRRGGAERGSAAIALAPGRLAQPRAFAWDELQP